MKLASSALLVVRVKCSQADSAGTLAYRPIHSTVAGERAKRTQYE